SGEQKRVAECPEPETEILETDTDQIIGHKEYIHQSLSSLPVSSRKMSLSVDRSLVSSVYDRLLDSMNLMRLDRLFSCFSKWLRSLSFLFVTLTTCGSSESMLFIPGYSVRKPTSTLSC